jgi:hypothetical protein
MYLSFPDSTVDVGVQLRVVYTIRSRTPYNNVALTAGAILCTKNNVFSIHVALPALAEADFQSADRIY